ncbi:MAG: MBL fold metallo-hydrolase [Motiliproteus sp.]
MKIKLMNTRGFAAALLMASTVVSANTLVKVDDHVYAYLGTDDYSAANSYGANAGIVIGEDAVLVIDTQISSQRAQQFIAAIRTVTDKPIRYALNTHFHSDHSFGNADFAALGATVISHTMADSYMKKWSQKILDKGWSGLTQEQSAGTRIVYPDVTFSESLSIDLGGIRPQLVFNTHSHTKGSVFFHLPEQKILFAGDLLFNDYHPNMGASDVDGWVETLDRVSALDIETIVPGHGPLSGKQDLAELRSYLLMFDEKAKEFATDSADIKAVQAKLLAVMPHRSHGESAIKSSLKWKYMRKPAKPKPVTTAKK